MIRNGFLTFSPLSLSLSLSLSIITINQSINRPIVQSIKQANDRDLTNIWIFWLFGVGGMDRVQRWQHSAGTFPFYRYLSTKRFFTQEMDKIYTGITKSYCVINLIL